MISKIIAFLIIFGILFSFLNGSTEIVASAILSQGAEAVSLITTIAGGICFWSGLMEVASRAKITDKLSKLIAPLTRLIFPKLKQNGEAMKYVSMNMVANLLGLGNAATPFGIKAIEEMAKEERFNGIATNSMVAFVVLNTASFQLIPTTVAMIRMSFGSEDPFGVVTAVWAASAFSLVCGLSACYIFRKSGGKD